ncbi:MAG: hypothetical protein IJV00_01825 [Clostridia bacterium]|nr:hypothetical protein [Clostridia bacterium]
MPGTSRAAQEDENTFPLWIIAVALGAALIAAAAVVIIKKKMTGTKN